jgi:hypothetical protein
MAFSEGRRCRRVRHEDNHNTILYQLFLGDLLPDHQVGILAAFSLG